MTTDPTTTGIAYFFFGGFIGFVVGYAIKKMIKLTLIVLGLFFSALIYLQHIGWIDIKWPKIQTDVTHQGQQLANQSLTAINQTAHQLAHTSISSPDAFFPYIGVVGFIPGLILGLKRG